MTGMANGRDDLMLGSDGQIARKKQHDADVAAMMPTTDQSMTDEAVVEGVMAVQDPMQEQAETALAEGIEEQKELELVRIGGGLVGLPISAALAGADLLSLPILLSQGVITAEEGEIASSILKQFENMPSAYVGAQLKDAVAGMGFAQETVDAFGEGYLAGELLAITSSALPGLKLAAKGAAKLKEGVTNYAAGAEARIAERGSGVTLQSGVDPMAAVDEAIAGLNTKTAKAPTDEEEGFIAFSGSPSDFNRFSLSKIGTGEGNQQFGYGLYFSDIEDIARFYRDALSDRQPISLDDLDTDAPAVLDSIGMTRSEQAHKGFLKENDPDFDEYMQEIEDYSINKTSSPLTVGFTDYEMKDGSVIRVSEGPDDALQEIDPRVVIEALGEPTGKIYKVKINAIKDELVDQTKPLGKQPKKVQDALSDIGDNLTLDDALNLGFDPFELSEQQALKKAKEMLLDPESDVLSFLSNMQSIRGSVNAGEKALSDRGVKGMRYLTGAARQRRPIKAEQNYVIFDDKIIDILEKYGIVGPVAVSTVIASQGEQGQGEAQ